MMPSRCSSSRLLGMVGTRLKYFRLEAEIIWYRFFSPTLFRAIRMMCLGKRLVLLPRGRSFSISRFTAWRVWMPRSWSIFQKGISI